MPEPLLDLPAEQFSIGHLKAVRQAVVDAGLARKTCNDDAEKIRLAFKWAAIEELIPSTVSQALYLLPGLKLGRTEAPEPDPDRR